MSEQSTALAVSADVVMGDALPVPLFSGAQMAQALIAYRELQKELDRAMPDQIMRIADRSFRKKGYWRALAVAFNLDVVPVDEQYVERGTFADGRPNFGYLVTYAASTKAGRSISGDGACLAIEKAERFRCPHPQNGNPSRSEHYPHETCPEYDDEFRWRALPPQATDHNLRAHAHTRAFNRAVSNLVAFGEVSAEEIDSDDRDASPGQRRSTSTGNRISDAQKKRLWAIARGKKWTDVDVRALVASHGFEHSEDITRDKYDAIVALLEGKP